MNFLKHFPSISQLNNKANSLDNKILKTNGHIHTPYSFSCFENIEQPFYLAIKENIAVLGINDFFVTDGYEAFHNQAVKNKVFPLFNIEFIGLLKEEQQKGIRVNDPNNPGRIYFCGKGLDYPYVLAGAEMQKLKAVIAESQRQIIAMINKANNLFTEANVPITLSFNEIKKKYARELVRERHLAKAIRIAVFENTTTDIERKQLFKKIYGGKDTKFNMADFSGLENEIRGNLLKAGGLSFVPEDENAFLPLNDIINIITKAGGIPCYPTLLDDSKGTFTEYEANYEQLYTELTKRNIWCLELIPNRNDLNTLKNFVNFFNNKGFVILFGTEHNAPELIPLTVETRGGIPLDNDLTTISYNGACVVAAHQYLRAKGETGYIDSNGMPKFSERDNYIRLGNMVIKHYLAL